MHQNSDRLEEAVSIDAGTLRLRTKLDVLDVANLFNRYLAEGLEFKETANHQFDFLRNANHRYKYGIYNANLNGGVCSKVSMPIWNPFIFFIGGDGIVDIHIKYELPSNKSFMAFVNLLHEPEF